MGEKPPPVRNLSRNLRAMKFMRRGENHLDLEAEAVDLKTKPEQWFRDVEQIPEKKLGNDASLVECMDLRYIFVNKDKYSWSTFPLKIRIMVICSKNMACLANF